MSLLSILTPVIATCFGCHAQNAPITAESDPAVAPWTPASTTIDPDFVNAVKFLHEHGLGDPRGGDYCRAQVRVGNIWSGGGPPVETKGWLLKDGKFVAWNGLVYRPDKVVAKLDLDKDLRPASEPTKKPQMFGRQVGETVGLDEPRSSIGCGLLLLIGKAKEAQSFLPDMSRQSRGLVISTLQQYLSARFDRALAAHMRGDDKLALFDSTSLKTNWPAFEKFAEAYAPKPFNGGFQSPTPAENTPKAVFEFLRPINDLATDSEQRLKTGPVPKLDLAAIKKLTQEERVKKLIAGLNEITPRQMGQPGGVSPTEDPIAAALVDEGTKAVPALLDCMEHDRRLTRAVSFGRDFFPYRNLITVRSAAVSIFQDIYQAYEFRDDRGTPTNVATLRAFYEKNKDASPMEVVYNRLKDDSGSPMIWTEAAHRLVEPASMRRTGGWSTIPKAGEKGIKGEVLRTRRNPSVTDLLIKRIQEAASNTNPSSFGDSNAVEMTIALARWDLEAAKPLLREKIDTLQASLKTNNPMFQSCNFGLVNAFLVKSGDRTKLHAYAETMIQLSNHSMFGQEAQWLAPFWWYPNDPEVQQLASKFFSHQRETEFDSFVRQTLGNITRSDAFREQFLVALKDKTFVEWFQVMPDRPGMLHTSNQNFTLPTNDPDAPRVGQKRSRRRCDEAAAQLQFFKEAPRFQEWWSDQHKDQVIRQTITWFEKQNSSVADSSPFTTGRFFEMP